MKAPAIVSTIYGDVAANPLGRALYAPVFGSTETPPNSARFAFLDPTKRVHDPIVGGLQLSFETLMLDADDLRVARSTAEAGSASQQALDLLASWTATPRPTAATPSAEPLDP